MKEFQRILLFFLLGFLILPSLISCHKFKEDPFISFKRPWKRLEHYNWHLTKYLVDGVDSLNNYRITPSDTNGWNNLPYIYFKGNGNYHGNNNQGVYWGTVGANDGGHHWSIYNEGTLYLSYEYDGYFPPGGKHLFPHDPRGGSGEWIVKELYKKNLKIKTTLWNRTYEIWFEGK